MISDLAGWFRQVVRAIDNNTEAVRENTATMRELLAIPEQRVSGSAGIATGEEFPRGKVTRAK